MNTPAPLTVAETFIKPYIVAFPLAFPSKFSLLAVTLFENGYEWENHRIVRKDTTVLTFEPQLTEYGWEEFRYNETLPTRWSYPSGTLLANIPDNADKSWLAEIKNFCSDVLTLDVDVYQKWLESQFDLANYSPSHRDETVDEAIERFTHIRELIVKWRVLERIEFIEKLQSGYVAPVKPKVIGKDSVVRHQTGDEVAVVRDASVKFGNQPGCILSTPIKGTIYWPISELVVVG
jgi:hypothetical protein